MANDTVTPDHFSDLWNYIGQLEAILDALNDSMNEMSDARQEDKRDIQDRAHNLVHASQTIADLLAKAARVR